MVDIIRTAELGSLVRQIRMEVAKIASARNMQPAQANQLFQQNFEHQLDKLIAAIRTPPC